MYATNRNIQLELEQNRNVVSALMASGPGWGANQLQPQTAPGGFVLEGVREDYSGSMSVFPCRGMFRRLAAMGPPAKTPFNTLGRRVPVRKF